MSVYVHICKDYMYSVKTERGYITYILMSMCETCDHYALDNSPTEAQCIV